MAGALNLPRQLETWRTRRAAYVAAGAALLLHLLFLPTIAKNLLPRERAVIQPVEPRPQPPKPEDTFRYTLVPDERPEDDPTDATAHASASRLARAETPRLDLPEGDPFVDEERAVPDAVAAPERVARRMTPAPPPVPLRRPEPVREPVTMTRPEPALPASIPQPKEGNLQHAEQPRPEPKPQPKLPPRAAQNPESAPAVPPPTPQPPAPQPKFKDLRQESPSRPRSGPATNRATSARLAGTQAMKLLRHRWGPYMDEVAKRLQQAFYAECSAARQSFQVGSVTIHFAIQPDGTLGNPRVLQADAAMLVERDLCWRSVHNAAPFPPLTAEMQQDENFGQVMVEYIFR